MKEAEIEVGIIALDEKIYESENPSGEDVLRLFDLDPTAFRGINYLDRVAFLKSNGYDITRENLLNANLSATSPRFQSGAAS